MAESVSAEAGKLSIVPTPIGNLGDITLRAIEVLEGADAIYAEDTRVTGKLLSALGVEAVKPLRLDENVLAWKAAEVAARVRAGESVAYCTDAGMPGVSDPGIRLVAAMRDEGLPVEVLPGPSAAACAYVASGFATTAYYFGGFFPRKQGERADLLKSLELLDAALVFYESPNRLVSALRSIADAFPTREVAVCRELTKLHEEVLRLPAMEAVAEMEAREQAGRIKGEIAIVIDGPSPEEGAARGEDARASAVAEAARLAAAGATQKAIAKEIAARFGIARNDAYDIALAARNGVDGE